MRTFIIILLLGLSLYGHGQLRPPSPPVNIRPLHERQVTQEKRVVTMIAVNLAIFAVNEYALHTDNKQLRQGCTYAFFSVNITGAAWVLSSSTITDTRPLKARRRSRHHY